MGHGVVEGGRAVSANDGHDGDGFRADGGERPAARVRHAPRPYDPRAVGGASPVRDCDWYIREAERGLVRALEDAYGPLPLVAVISTPWASATFDGARHEVFLAAAVPLPGLAEREFVLPESFVADIVARGDGDGLVIEALTIVAM